MQARALSPFGIELCDFTLRGATEDDLRAFSDVFRQHSLVLIHYSEMAADDQIALIGRLGTVVAEGEGCGKSSNVAHDPRIPKSPDFGKGEIPFHFDLCATDDWPYQILSLYGEVVPATGGETKFAHGGHAFAKLNERTREAVRGRRAVHIFDPYAPPSVSRPTEELVGKFAERGVHDIVRQHPYGNAKVLTVAFATTARVVGMSNDEGAPLIDEMFDALYAPDATYVHRWEIGDLLVWDNRVVQHARNDFDQSQRRSLRRVVIGDGASIQTRYQRWFEQIPIEADATEKYLPGRVQYPGDLGIWYGMPRAVPSTASEQCLDASYQVV